MVRFCLLALPLAPYLQLLPPPWAPPARWCCPPSPSSPLAQRRVVEGRGTSMGPYSYSYLPQFLLWWDRTSFLLLLP